MDHPFLNKAISELEERVVIVITRRAAIFIQVGHQDKVHVATRQIEARTEGAKGVDLGIAKETPGKPLQVLDELSTQPILKITRLDVGIKVGNFFVKPE